MRRSAVLDELVHGYPSHDYIIDYHELRELGLNARLFAPDQRDAVRQAVSRLMHDVEETTGALIRLVMPAKAIRKPRTDNVKED